MSKLESYQGLVLVIKSLCLMEILLSNWHPFLFIAIKKPPKTKINQRIKFVNIEFKAPKGLEEKLLDGK